MAGCIHRLRLRLVLVPAAAASAESSADVWHPVAGTPTAARAGAERAVRPDRFKALTLDRRALAAVLAGAPRERATEALAISLPAPGGGFERFAVRRSSVMEPGLASRHPEIATYAGAGIDEPGATVHLDLTSLGFHASVRGPGGSWYVDPYYHGDESLYASYRGADLPDPHGGPREREPPRLTRAAARRAGVRRAPARPSGCARTASRSRATRPTPPTTARRT